MTRIPYTGATKPISLAAARQLGARWAVYYDRTVCMNCCAESREKGHRRCGKCRTWFVESPIKGSTRPDLARPLLDRFNAKWTEDPRTRCWVWHGAHRGHGYGSIWVTSAPGIGQQISAHRVAYALFIGPIPDGKQIDHRCRNRGCVNPAHLEPVTAEENLKRSPYTHATRNSAKTQCPRGHVYDAKNTLYDKNGGRSCRACYQTVFIPRRKAKRAT